MIWAMCLICVREKQAKMVLRRLKISSRGGPGSSPGAGVGKSVKLDPRGVKLRGPILHFWGEKWPGNSSWALLEVTTFFFI